jgi:hypothetical protein
MSVASHEGPAASSNEAGERRYLETVELARAVGAVPTYEALREDQTVQLVEAKVHVAVGADQPVDAEMWLALQEAEGLQYEEMMQKLTEMTLSHA